MCLKQNNNFISNCFIAKRCLFICTKYLYKVQSSEKFVEQRSKFALSTRNLLGMDDCGKPSRKKTITRIDSSVMASKFWIDCYVEGEG